MEGKIPLAGFVPKKCSSPQLFFSVPLSNVKELERRLGATLPWVGACWCCWAYCKPMALFPSTTANPWREGGNYPWCFRQLHKCPPQAWQVPGMAAGKGSKLHPHTGVREQSWTGSPCEQPLHRAGLTNSSVLLMTCRDCGDTGRVRQTDGQQLLRMAALAPALEMVLAAPLFSQSCSPGLTLMAEFVGAAMSWLLVKTFVFVAYWGFENNLSQRKMHLLGNPYFRMNLGVL